VSLELVLPVLRIRNRYPGSGAFSTPGWVKNQDEQPGSYFRELKKILKIFVVDPGPVWKKFGSGIEKFGSGIRINIPDPQHCNTVFTVGSSNAPDPRPLLDLDLDSDPDPGAM
jgi:hypothetical protein